MFSLRFFSCVLLVACISFVYAGAPAGAHAGQMPAQFGAQPDTDKPGSPTLAAVKLRGKLLCAVISEEADWDKDDLHGNLVPLTAEICRAMAAAIFGNPDDVQIAPAPAEADALTALRLGQVDVALGATPSITTAKRMGVVFGPPVFWDAQTFMVKKSSHVTSMAGLADKTVCYIEGTENDGVLDATVQAHGIRIRPFPFQEQGEMDGALVGGHCWAETAYTSKLAEVRADFISRVQDFVMLPDRLVMSPASIVTRRGDPGWSALAAATVDALTEAQELGVTKANIAQKLGTDDPVLRRLVGTDWSTALALDLPKDWSERIIAKLGNYGEIYTRTVGEGSKLGMQPGPNADCLHGGIMCPAPLQ